jgi:hypothetical protein
MRLLTIIVCLLIIGCKKEKGFYISNITLVNAVPLSTGYTLKINDQIAGTNIEYAKPQYKLPVASGTQKLSWFKNGATVADSSFYFDFKSGQQYQLIFYDSAHKYKTLLATENTNLPFIKNRTYMQFYNLIVGSNNLVLANDTNRVYISGSQFADFAGKAAVFNELDTVTNKFRLFNVTTTAKVLDSINLNLKPGVTHTLYNFGIIGNTGAAKPKMLLKIH